ncbi:glycoside hydrolase domain-containing protein [Kribbella deserti]|uniref:Glycoside hydrolase domain-containing protein n=1 Tax=Kribbella deserti TaxID=1926257 RepID=A0ABV6QRX0_9ACTN
MRKIFAALLVTTLAITGTTTAAPAAAEADQRTGSQIGRQVVGDGPEVWTEPSSASVFRDSRPSAQAGRTVTLDTGRNEYEGGQIVLRSDRQFSIETVQFTALSGPGGAQIGAGNLAYHFVDYQDLERNSLLPWWDNKTIYPVIRNGPAAFPDGLSNRPSTTVAARTTQPIWINAYVPKTTPPGLYEGTASVVTNAGHRVVPIKIDVRAVDIPDAIDSGFSQSMWTLLFGDISWSEYPEETIKKYYGVERYSPGWWELAGNVAKSMKQHRTNNLAIPMVTMLLDGGTRPDAQGRYTFNWARFDQVVQFFIDAGMAKRLEGFWLAGGPNNRTKWDLEIIGSDGRRQWVPYDSPAANNWIDQYVPALRDHLAAKSWTNKWWMHVGDEPAAAHAQEAYNAIANRIKQHWPQVKLGDASFHDFLRPRTDILIPNMLAYGEHTADWDAGRAEGKELWLYNCNLPVGNYLNRAIDQPQWNQRLTMWFAYSRQVTGYLHWAFNNWQYNIKDQDVKGDAWIVLPDKDRMTIESTVRYESLRDGLEDWEVLTLIGKTNAPLARQLGAALASRGDLYTPDTQYMTRVRRLALDIASGRSVPDPARTATATATVGSPANAIDDDPATTWHAGQNGQLKLDLGRQTQVDTVRLTGTNLANTKIAISYDGSRWTEVPNVTTGLTGLNAKTRHVRIETAGEVASAEISGTPLTAANLAGGRSYTLSPQPDAEYPDAGLEATDGIPADAWDDGRTYGYKVVNGQTRTASLTVDLGSTRTIDNVRAHAYEEYPAYRPSQVRVLTSVDGIRYTQRGTQKSANGNSGVWYDVDFNAVPARYVRVEFTKAGGDVMFLDEVEVYEAATAPKHDLAWGRTYTKSAPPDPAYPDAGNESTDGQGAGGYDDGLGYGYQLAAGETKTVDLNVDLGSTRAVERLRLAKFDDGDHDYTPDRVEVIVNGSAVASTGLPTGRWYDLAFDRVTARYVTVRLTKTHGHYADYLFVDEINVYGDLGPNLVRGVTHEPTDPPYPDTANAESVDARLAGHYTDGLSYGFHLNAGQTRTVELAADLGQTKPVRAVSLREYADGEHNYRPDQVVVLTSTDGVTYTERATTSAPGSRWFDLAFASVDARHVKVRLTKAHANFADYIFADELTVH